MVNHQLIKAANEDFRLIFKKGAQALKVETVVSKKIAPRAVDRNRIKRLTREALNDFKSNLKGEMVVIVGKNFAKLKKFDVTSSLGELLGQLQ